ncbi:MAG: NUDIX domain-containing protein [Pseudomonadota bacterium]
MLNNITIHDAIAFLEHQVVNSSKGLPQELFFFVTRMTPMVNVDLLVRDETGRILLAWRDDQFAGAGWHVPGGIIRFKETMMTRLLKIADTEIGAVVELDAAPIAINEVICEHDTRGHFISVLYRGYLSSKFEPKNMGLKDTDPGYLAWHSVCPNNLVTVHEMYRIYLNNEKC